MKALTRADADALRARVKAIPVVETFGPTVQGEGPDAGRRCVFVRFGGCDYQCSWCDSLHAVLPSEVRKAERLTVTEIVSRVDDLTGNVPTTVVFSGGNPLLHDLTDLVAVLHDLGYRIVVETQGTRWKPWVRDASLVVVSPKPPSSGMVTDWNDLERFLNETLYFPPAVGDNPMGPPDLALKVVVGDDADYEYAVTVHERFHRVPFYISVLNPNGSADEFDVLGILEGYRVLCERVASDPRMEGVRVMPQLHTLAWGNAKGV